MPSYKTKAALKRRKRGLYIPELKKDIKDVFAGRITRNSKEERVSAYVQARGM